MTRARTDIGIIGERRNVLSHAFLAAAVGAPSLNVKWFVEADLAPDRSRQLYGEPFDYGRVVQRLRRRRSAPDCRQFCRDKGIDYVRPHGHDLENGLPDSFYTAPQIDYVLIAGCDHILKRRALGLARKKIVNYHYSLLPAYRGKNAVFWQWYNGENQLGYTFHEVDEGIDTGPVVYQREVVFDDNPSSSQMWQRIVADSTAHIEEVFECLAKKRPIEVANDGSRRDSYYPNKEFRRLITIAPDRSVQDVVRTMKRVGVMRLANNFAVNTLVSSSDDRSDSYRLDNDGIVCPLADGQVKVRAGTKLRFLVLKTLIGRRILQGLLVDQAIQKSADP